MSLYEFLLLQVVCSYTVGIDVEYAMPLPNVNVPAGTATLRHLLILWTGDHVAQCEISKAQSGCRFCHLKGN